ncbi:hypothetical protein Ae201684P_022477 [Aphanomyces euteiches]|nr:hypothetical protein Ae201684P_022477 [Aphanomyces euteiches]
MPDETPGESKPVPLGLTLGFFKRFIEIHGGREAFQGLTTGDVCTRFLLPYTASTKLSLVEHVRQQPDGHLYAKPATWFVSHAWSYVHLDVVDALDDFFQENGLDDSVAVWFCTFCNNQHEIKSQVHAFEHWFGIFRSSLRSIGNVVMVMSPWNDPITLMRTWCVFEVYASIVENARFEIAMGKSQRESFLLDMQSEESAFTKMLGTIKSEKSQTTVPSDRDNIFKLIQDEVGFTKLDRMVFEAIEKWVLRAVDDQIERATSLEIKAEWLNRKASLIVTNGQIDVGALISQQCYDLYCQEGDKYDKLPAKWDTLSQLAIIKMYQGRPLDEVEPMFLEALNHQIELLTKNHIHTLATMNYLGTCYINHRKYDLALPIFMECFELRVQLLGEEDPWTRETMGNISGALRLQHKPDEALKWSTRCYDIECRSFGGDGSFRTRNEMGLGYLALGDFVRAEEQFQAVCQECRRMYGSAHHQTIITDSNLALVYRQQGMYSDAEKILLQCLDKGSAIVRTKEYYGLGWFTWELKNTAGRQIASMKLYLF